MAFLSAARQLSSNQVERGKAAGLPQTGVCGCGPVLDGARIQLLPHASPKDFKMTSEPEVELPETNHANRAEATWRILFVDSKENNELLKEACKEFGYAVIGASTLEEAWLFLNGENHVDVIVCAAHLEHESMFDFLHGVRKNEIHRTAAFMILSLEPTHTGSRLDRSAAAAGLLLGADAFVLMPVFDVDSLVQHLRRLQPEIPTLVQKTSGG